MLQDLLKCLKNIVSSAWSFTIYIFYNSTCNSVKQVL